MQQPLGFGLADTFPHRNEVLVRHQFGDLLLRISGEAHIAIGENADQFARCIGAGTDHHWNAGDAVILHERQRIDQLGVRTNGQRIHHHAGFEFLDLPHLCSLTVAFEIAMDHTDAAGLRHGDRHAGFSHGVHGRSDDRNVERDRTGQVATNIGFRRQNVGQAWFQQHIVECESLANTLTQLFCHCQLRSAARGCDKTSGCAKSSGPLVRRSNRSPSMGLAVVDSMKG